LPLQYQNDNSVLKTINRTSKRKLKQKRLSSLSGNQHGMSVTELMVAICILGILAAVAIPSYISYVQQSRVVSLIIPRLHLIETNISLFYSTNNRLPGNSDIADILKNIDTEYCDITLANGSIVMKIKASDRSAKLHILDGKVLLASPVIAKYKIVSWHLTGELADRLKISY
jgi:prepilin-type N-terminal cleavage/methylation domain-containing protein